MASSAALLALQKTKPAAADYSDSSSSSSDDEDAASVVSSSSSSAATTTSPAAVAVTNTTALYQEALASMPPPADDDSDEEMPPAAAVKPAKKPKRTPAAAATPAAPAKPKPEGTYGMQVQLLDVPAGSTENRLVQHGTCITDPETQQCYLVRSSTAAVAHAPWKEPGKSIDWSRVLPSMLVTVSATSNKGPFDEQNPPQLVHPEVPEDVVIAQDGKAWMLTTKAASNDVFTHYAATPKELGALTTKYSTQPNCDPAKPNNPKMGRRPHAVFHGVLFPAVPWRRYRMRAKTAKLSPDDDWASEADVPPPAAAAVATPSRKRKTAPAAAVTPANGLLDPAQAQKFYLDFLLGVWLEQQFTSLDTEDKVNEWYRKLFHFVQQADSFASYESLESSVVDVWIKKQKVAHDMREIAHPTGTEWYPNCTPVLLGTQMRTLILIHPEARARVEAQMQRRIAALQLKATKMDDSV